MILPGVFVVKMSPVLAELVAIAIELHSKKRRFLPMVDQPFAQE